MANEETYTQCDICGTGDDRDNMVYPSSTSSLDVVCQSCWVANFTDCEDCRESWENSQLSYVDSCDICLSLIHI